ncbi:MAG: hypothetical protein IKD69_07765, partial [Solobacterium sp.]|nr:hypothetical protein [Solobacterium sp.]
KLSLRTVKQIIINTMALYVQMIQGHDTKGFAIGREFGSTTLSMYFIDCVFADKTMISIIAESYEENE